MLGEQGIGTKEVFKFECLMASSEDGVIHSFSYGDSLAMGGNSLESIDWDSLLDNALIEYCLHFSFKTLLLCISIAFNRHIPSQKVHIFSQVIEEDIADLGIISS